MTESSAARTRALMCSALICCFAASGALAAPWPSAASWHSIDAMPAAVRGPQPLSVPASLRMADSVNEGGGTFLTTRRGLGVVFLAGGVVMALKGLDYRDEADSFYASYKAATDEAEIEKFYQRTTNRDVKSQVSWALAAAFGITGVRLLFTGHDTGASAAMTAKASRQRLSIDAAVMPGTVGLRLRHPFY